jgi:hypothetical protein
MTYAVKYMYLLPAKVYMSYSVNAKIRFKGHFNFLSVT